VAEPLLIDERQGLGLAAVMARKGVGAAAIGAAIGLAPLAEAGRTARADLALISTGPGVWLAVVEDVGGDWPAALEGQLDGLCAVSDQSGAYGVFRISGPGARDLLQRGVAIDLHPDAFAPGSAAATVIAHIGVILWRPGQDETFEVAVFRSYVPSFRHWIDVNVAIVAPPAP
jgi:sarcosine oxidase subunit gamma